MPSLVLEHKETPAQENQVKNFRGLADIINQKKRDYFLSFALHSQINIKYFNITISEIYFILLQ